MYRVVNLPRKVLITTDEVVSQGPTDNSVDVRVLLSAIQIAEERFIKPLLGKELYYDFRTKKNTVVDSTNNADLTTAINSANDTTITLKNGEIVNAIEMVDNDWYTQLWNEYLWKLCAECVVYVASPTNYSRFTASGEMINNPKTVTFQGDGRGAASIDRSDMQWKLDKLLMDRIQPLIAAMEEWLCDYKENFPLYKKCKCDNDENTGISLKGKTGWIHGIYEKKRRFGNHGDEDKEYEDD